jgi:DNA-binding response OmpR family regulator
VLDLPRFDVRWRGQPVTLTRSEFQLLVVLARHRGMVLSRERQLEAARGDDTTVTDRTVDTFIKRLRKKIRDVDPAFDEIETVIGIGYRYRE